MNLHNFLAYLVVSAKYIMQICTKMRRRAAWLTTLAVFAVDRSAKKIALNRKEWRKALPLQNSVQLSVVNYCSSTMSGFAEIVRSSHYSPVFRLCMYTEVCWDKKSRLDSPSSKKA